MPPPMTPAPRTPTRAIFRGLTPAPGAPRASTPVSFLTSSIRKKRPMRLRMTGVPMSDRTPSTSNSSAFAKSSPNPFSTTPSAVSGAGYWLFVSFRTDWRAFEKTIALSAPSRNFSTSFSPWRRRAARTRVRALFRADLPPGERLRPIPEDRLRDDLVHEADPLRTLRGENLPREDDVEGVCEADHAWEARRAAPGRQDAELDLRKADLGLRRVGREPPVHRESGLAAAAHASAVDRGDRGKRQIRELIEGPVPAPDHLGIRVPVGLCDLVHVRAGDEDSRLGREKQERFHVGTRREAVDDALELPHDGRRELVHLLAWRVEDEKGEAIRLDREPEGGERAGRSRGRDC